MYSHCTTHGHLVDASRITMTTIASPRRETERKARRQPVTFDLFTANVEGLHGFYTVQLDTFDCNCKAYEHLHYCSHGMSVLLEINEREGLTTVFCPDEQHAAAALAEVEDMGFQGSIRRRGPYLIVTFR